MSNVIRSSCRWSLTVVKLPSSTTTVNSLGRSSMMSAVDLGGVGMKFHCVDISKNQPKPSSPLAFSWSHRSLELLHVLAEHASKNLYLARAVSVETDVEL